MIYWEQVSPSFDVMLPDFLLMLNPQNRWVADESTRGYWSRQMPESLAEDHIKTVLLTFHRSPHDFLVIYANPAPDQIQVVVVADNLNRSLLSRNYNREPPYWWDTYTRVWNRLREHTPKIKEAMRSFMADKERGLRGRMPAPERKDGYCRICCLPMAKHVPHEPLQRTRPDDMNLYYRKCRESYLKALDTLSLREVSEMPLPVHKARMEALHEFLGMSNPKKPQEIEPSGRLDILLGDSLDI